MRRQCWGGNKSVLQNCTFDDSTFKKKHVAISYHISRECAAAGIVHPLKREEDFNFADICKKFDNHKDLSCIFKWDNDELKNEQEES